MVLTCIQLQLEICHLGIHIKLMRRSLHESKTTQTEINCSQILQFQTLFRSFVGSLVCARYQKNNNLTSHHLLGGSIAHSRLSGHRPSANDVTGGGWGWGVGATTNSAFVTLQNCFRESSVVNIWRHKYLTSVTRFGNLLNFGQLFKAFGNNYFAQIAHISSTFL